MCFGAAFIGSNLTSNYKVASVLLTHKPDFDVVLKIAPIKPEEALTEADQKALGIEESDLVKYLQEFTLFNATQDYYGKSKSLTMNYDKNMRLQLFRGEELLDEFLLKDIEEQIKLEMIFLEN